MKRLIATTFALTLMGSAPEASELSIANWNIQTLTYPGDPLTVFEDGYRRTDRDFGDLRVWRDLVSSDLYFLQEVSSPAAIDAIFPASEGWSYCISGQFSALEGLNVRPLCIEPNQQTVFPKAEKRGQFTAVAIRPGSAVKLTNIQDYSALNVKSNDRGEIRDVRWGLDVEFEAGSVKSRALVVHLKSGCFDDYISYKEWQSDPSTKVPSSRACETIGRQMYPLRKWIEDREAANERWVVVGDFNRRLDAGAGRYQDEIWTAISGFSPNRMGEDRDSRADISLYRVPYKKPSACWQEFSNVNATLANADAYNMLPIEFFLYGKAASEVLVSATEKQIAWPNPKPEDLERLSDHCPSSVDLHF